MTAGTRPSSLVKSIPEHPCPAAVAGKTTKPHQDRRGCNVSCEVEASLRADPPGGPMTVVMVEMGVADGEHVVESVSRLSGDGPAAPRRTALTRNRGPPRGGPRR